MDDEYEYCMGCGSSGKVRVDMVEIDGDLHLTTDEEYLGEIDCQPNSDFETDPDIKAVQKKEPWRRPTVCGRCTDRLDADMWISQACWNRIDPIVPYEKLPLMPED